MEMLNAFDSVVAGGSSKKSNSDCSGQNELQSQVYRMILKSQRERAFQSIQDITEEINHIKSKQSYGLTSIIGEVGKSSRNTAKVTDIQAFEFEGSFGGEYLSKELKSIKATQQKLQLPKISLDSVLDMQKNESFVSRCQKCKCLV